MKLSQSDLMIIEAKKAGYYATLCGRVFDKNNKEIKGSPLKNSKHLRMTLYVDGFNKYGYCSVLKHRFVSYFFKGDSVFNSPLIRHKNDVADDNRISNLIAGTHKENRADISRDRLSKIAKDNSHLLVERSRKLSDDQVLEMRERHSTHSESYKTISKLFGVSAMTAYRAINNQSWKGV